MFSWFDVNNSFCDFQYIVLTKNKESTITSVKYSPFQMLYVNQETFCFGFEILKLGKQSLAMMLKGYAGKFNRSMKIVMQTSGVHIIDI